MNALKAEKYLLKIFGQESQCSVIIGEAHLGDYWGVDNTDTLQLMMRLYPN
jgi:hypothetical protein